MGRTTGGNHTPPTWGELAPDLEQDLVRRCRGGSREAQQELYRRCRRHVVTTLHHLVDDDPTLDHLAEQVFVLGFRRLAQFRGDVRLSTWLSRLCVQVALRRLRVLRRQRSSVPKRPRMDCYRVDVREVLEWLPPKQRVALVLQDVVGMDLAEIAYVVGSRALIVRLRLARARRAFYRRAAQGDA
jgi:RNA polymerase sigma-70 factor, ECF subfamily